MIKPNDFDTARAEGASKSLPATGYVCKILAVEETKTRVTNRPMLIINFDIHEGEYANWFKDKYATDTRKEKKWQGRKWVLVYNEEDKTHPMFKGFITAVEDSNPGFKTAWCDGSAFTDQFKNKFVGVLFGREQFQTNDGKLCFSTKPNRFLSVQNVREGKFEIPNDRLLKSDEIIPTNSVSSDGFMALPDGVEDDGLPFA